MVKGIGRDKDVRWKDGKNRERIERKSGREGRMKRIGREAEDLRGHDAGIHK